MQKIFGEARSFSVSLLFLTFFTAAAAFADDFSDKALPSVSPKFDGPFNADGRIMIVCREGSTTGHLFIAMGYEWTTSNKKIHKGRIFEWATDNGCQNYVKTWTKGRSVFFDMEDYGSRGDQYESPRTCTEEYKWDPKKQEFIGQKSKCLTAVWEIENKKAHTLFKSITRKIRAGEIDALKTLSKADVRFLRNRLNHSTENFRQIYEPQMREAALLYLSDLKNTKPSSEKLFRAHVNFSRKALNIPKWFEQNCPDFTPYGCQMHQLDRLDHQHAETLQAEHRTQEEEAKYFLMDEKYVGLWLSEIAKMSDGEMVFGTYPSYLLEEINELLSQSPAAFQAKYRLRLADLAHKFKTETGDPELYADYVFAAAETRQCANIPARAWRAILQRYDPDKATKESLVEAEKWLQGRLDDGDYESARDSLRNLAIQHAYRHECEKIPKTYFKKLAQIKK